MNLKSKRFTISPYFGHNFWYLVVPVEDRYVVSIPVKVMIL